MVKTRLEEIVEEKVREKAKELEIEGDIEELVEGVLSPEKEGYSWTWKELAEEVIREVVGERKIVFFPLAESWELLLVLENRVLGVVVPPKAPYLGWVELVDVFLEVEKQVRELLKEK